MIAKTLTLLLALVLTATPEAEKPKDAREVDASQWLSEIAKSLEEMKFLQARVRYDTVQGLVGDTQTRFGTLIYDANRPRRFRIDFDGLLVTGRSLKRIDETLVFDGRFLAEIKPQEKRFHRYELVPEQEMDAIFDLTDSRFPLPVDLNREQIESNYEVVLIDPVQPNPMIDKPMEGTVQLRLTPKPGREMTYAQMDIWFDRETKLPRLVHAIDSGDSGDESVIFLNDLKTDIQVADALFKTQAPTEPGWEVHFTPLNDGSRQEVRLESEVEVVDE